MLLYERLSLKMLATTAAEILKRNLCMRERDGEKKIYYKKVYNNSIVLTSVRFVVFSFLFFSLSSDAFLSEFSAD